MGVIGCGNMGQALIKGMLRSRFAASSELGTWDPDARKLRQFLRAHRIRAAASNERLVSSAGVILLAVKPQQMDQVLREIRPHLKHRPLVISIAAGISIRRIQQRLGEGIPVIRVMPNTPALVGAGISAVAAGGGVTKKELLLAGKIFSGVGKVVQVPESWMNAVTAVSGSGPAYFFFLMEQMIRAGIRLGLSPAAARELALATAEGSARLANASKENPAILRGRVTSKGGTTEAAFKVFERAGLGTILQAGIRAAAKRASELGG